MIYNLLMFIDFMRVHNAAFHGLLLHLTRDFTVLSWKPIFIHEPSIIIRYAYASSVWLL